MGGHVSFHVASRGGGSPLTLTFQQEGSYLNCSNEIIKKNSRSLRSLVFY